jgi:bifunctional non-homologous end joining protein LigD
MVQGMQVYLPLNTPLTYTATQSFARRVAELLAERHPRLIVSESASFVPSQSTLSRPESPLQQKSNVAVYSMRATGELPRSLVR